ncbi:MAG: PTS sugar transporter subunit IIB [Erysipelotrichaceae bacterium]
MNILLICSAGMSTSMLVTKMEAAAKAQNIEATIWAVGDASSAENVVKADVIMLGPQVRFLQNRIKTMVNNEKPVVCIDMAAYGQMNGEKVLATALEIYNASKGEH